MDIRQLRYFVALAEELHFGRAAQRLHLAQPALSQQLKVLERHLGLRLLDRTNRSVALTDAGRRLLDEAYDVLARFDQAVATMARVRTGEVGELALGVSPGIDPALLHELLVLYRRRAPAADVAPRELAWVDAVDALQRYEVDAALLHVVPDGGATRSIVLSSEPLGVALPSSHLLARLKSIPAARLSGEPLVYFRRRAEPEVYDRVLTAFAVAGAEFGKVHESPTVETSLSLVAAGVGVSPKFQREVKASGLVGVVWRPIADLALTVPTALVWRADDQPSPPLRQMLLAARAVRRSRQR